MGKAVSLDALLTPALVMAVPQICISFIQEAEAFCWQSDPCAKHLLSGPEQSAHSGALHFCFDKLYLDG
jgi:hypothetical protein